MYTVLRYYIKSKLKTLLPKQKSCNNLGEEWLTDLLKVEKTLIRCLCYFIILFMTQNNICIIEKTFLTISWIKLTTVYIHLFEFFKKNRTLSLKNSLGVVEEEINKHGAHN